MIMNCLLKQNRRRDLTQFSEWKIRFFNDYDHEG